LIGWYFDEGASPPLKLIFVAAGKVLGAGKVFGCAVYFKFYLWECGYEADFDEGNSEMGDVNANPVTV
jgi:hypothetical protein